MARGGGFDSEKDGVAAGMTDFIEAAAIPVCMVGLLFSLPHTQLGRRLEKEGRLGALRAFERPLFRRAHGPTLGSRRHKMRVRRQHKAPTALTCRQNTRFQASAGYSVFPTATAKRPAKLPSSFL